MEDFEKALEYKELLDYINITLEKQKVELDDNYDAFVGLHNTEDPEYDNLLDKEAIKDYEWDIARMHGDIEEYQVTRTNHSGIPYIFPMATINPFLGTNKIPEKNREDFNILLNISFL